MEFNLEQILESKNLNELRADENYVMMTPLIKFTMKNDINSVMQLLKAGANPNISDDWGTTPLEIATLRGNAELSRILLLYSANPDTRNYLSRTPLMELVIHVKKMLESQNIINIINVYNLYMTILQLLLKFGADTYKRDIENMDILDYNPPPEIYKLIIRWRAALIIQYNIKAKIFRNRIKKRIESKKLLLKDTTLPMELIKIVKEYI